ncbi:MAG TPA: type II toxin-antitoxin system VapB family antitoxin [Allosphingosinicella sp.]|nr:type II toxin-antitoxin system VapB family antitoxin [Allosphingosinicella sp.]
MGKYEPLAARLRGEKGQIWSATFAEVERTLGFALPASARTYREWWANQQGHGHSQTKGWQDAGWRVWKVDLEGERVTFKRAPAPAAPAAGSETEEGLLERAAKLLGTNDRGEIVREALRELIQREAGRRLMALGGTMPDLKVPPRERPL